MEEKYGKLNEKLGEKIKQLILLNTIKDENNNRIKCSFLISQEYKKYCESQLRARQSKTPEETQIECKVEKEFQQIPNNQGDKKKRITEMIIRNTIRIMKNKKVEDRLG